MLVEFQVSEVMPAADFNAAKSAKRNGDNKITYPGIIKDLDEQKNDVSVDMELHLILACMCALSVGNILQ